MRNWGRYCQNPGEDAEYYSYHARAEGAHASVIPLGRGAGRTWYVLVEVDIGHPTKRDAQQLAERLLSAVEAGR